MWVNYPNMPTGARATEALYRRLVEFGLKHKILICNDNPLQFYPQRRASQYFECFSGERMLY